MALGARPVGIATASNIASGHLSSGGRSMASSGSGPIDEISTRTQVQSGSSFSYQAFTDWMQYQQYQQTNTEPLANVSGRFDTSSSMFLSLLPQEQANNNELDTNSSGQPHPSISARASLAYEEVSQAIHPHMKALGSNFSLTS